MDACFDGEAALDCLGLATYDVAILDIMMPKVDGLAVVKAMRQAGNTTPVIFLTAKDTIEDRVKGLDMGANDYLVKPFSFDELMARLRAMTRRAVGQPTNCYTQGDLKVNVETNEVTR